MKTKTAEQAKELIEAIKAVEMYLDSPSNFRSMSFGNIYYQLNGEYKKLLDDHILQIKETLKAKLEAL